MSPFHLTRVLPDTGEKFPILVNPDYIIRVLRGKGSVTVIRFADEQWMEVAETLEEISKLMGVGAPPEPIYVRGFKKAGSVETVSVDLQVVDGRLVEVKP